MKKIIALTLLIILTSNIYVFADDELEEIHEGEELQEIIETSSAAEQAISINSRTAVVIERTTNKILYGKNENETRPMASTTKIMTRFNSS